MGVRPLHPELAEKARVELYEDPKKLEDGIQHLKDWIAKQPHLKARTDDQWLAAFLRGCKFSIERTKEKLDLFYSIKTLAPDMFTLKHTDPKFMKILKQGGFLVLPKVANPADPRVSIMRPGVNAPGDYKIDEIFSVTNVIQKILIIEDDNFIIAGGINVMDFSGTTIAHLTQMTPATMKKMTVAGQDATPVRMKAMHFFNPPPGFETIYNIAKNFLNEKNRKRMNVHGKDISHLHEHVSKDILPAEYGGNGGTIQEIIDYWVKKIEEHSAWLDEEEQFGTDESRRPGKPKTADETFGMDGSFRQLQFD